MLGGVRGNPSLGICRSDAIQKALAIKKPHLPIIKKICMQLYARSQQRVKKNKQILGAFYHARLNVLKDGCGKYVI